MEKMKLVMILALIGGILMAISLAMPWYTIEQEFDGKTVATVNYGWTEAEIEMDLGNGTETNSTSYEDAKMDNVGSTMQTTQIFAILGTVFSFLAFLFIMLKMKGSLGLGTPIVMIIVLLGFVCSILAPVYLMTSLPGAHDADDFKDVGYDEEFTGEKTTGIAPFEFTYTYGGGTGWILALVAGILNLLAFVFFLMGRNEL